jgi:methyl-accepting chemotaxis protein
MKKILLSAALLSSSLLFGQQKVELVEKRENLTIGSVPSITISMPYGSESEVEKELKSALKKWKGKLTMKHEFFLDDVELKEFGENTFDVYGKVYVEADEVKIAVSIDLGGAYLNSVAHPNKYKVMEDKLHILGNNITKEVLEDQFKDEQKELKKLNNELSKLVNKKNDLVSQISYSKADIASAETHIAHADDETEEGKKLIKKSENQINKSESKISSAEKGIEKNTRDQEAMKKEIEEQNKVVQKAQDKVDEFKRS